MTMHPRAIKIINRSPHPLPAYKTQGASCMDLTAWIQEGSTVLKPGETRIIPTGIFLGLGPDQEAQVRGRSGLARQGIGLPHGIGTIDSDYRGEVGVILHNSSQLPFRIADGDRIAQLHVRCYTRVEWEPVSELDPTTRGEGGFGSTGVQSP